MLKNVIQSLIAILAAFVFALGWPVWIGYAALIFIAVLAAFESLRWLSALEVFITVLTIVFCSTWYFGLVGAGLLAIWNMAQWIAPLKQKLVNAG